MAYRLDQFEIGSELGSGGMAVVYSGHHLRSGLPVAIKVMTSQLAREPAHRRAFLREVRSTARLGHHGIVRVFDVGEIPPELDKLSQGDLAAGSPYLVMELIEGPTVAQLTEISWPQTQRMVLDLLDALAHAHSVGVIHRDIKPSNILLEHAGERLSPKLTDFGIARMFDIDRVPSSLETDRRIAGTPHYMAPERVIAQWRDQGPCTDLYSLGILVWKIVTGEHPFVGTTQEVLIAQVRELPPVFEPRFDVPERLESWLTGMLAKSPRHRFQRAADAAIAFREACRSPVRSAVGIRSETAAKLDLPGEPTVLLTPTTILERAPDEAYRRQAGLATDWPRPQVPPDWRTKPTGTVHYRRVLDAGLGLFGLRTIPMVGRDHERDTLWRALTEVRQHNRPRVVHVRGPAGMGKSRLVEWFSTRAAEVGGADVLRVVHSGTNHRADGLTGMLRRHFAVGGLREDETLVRVLSQLRALTRGPDELAEYDAAALTQMMTDDDEDDTRTSVDFAAPAERFHAVWRHLRKLARHRPQILCIEDAHLAIDAVRFVRFLVDEIEPDVPLLIVLASRTEGPFQTDSLREDLDAIAEHAGSFKISLGRMSDETLRLLVRRALGLSPELTEDVVRRAEGTPMFAVQAVADWVERNALGLGRNGYELAVDRASVPDDVHALWMSRALGLAETVSSHEVIALDALLIAAALGRWVDSAEWSECVKRFAPQLADDDERETLLRTVLDELQRLGLADQQRTGWSFAHGLMRESLQRHARELGHWTRLNKTCARALESMHDVTTPAIALRVANHLHEHDDDLAALDVVLAAIRGAKAAHDYDWLERLLTAAERVVASLGLHESDARRGMLDVTRARLLTVRNRLVEAQTACEQVIEDARRNGWVRVEAEANFQLGSNALSLGHTDEAIELFEHSYVLFETLGELRNLARAREGVGYAYLHQGRYREAKPHVEAAGELYASLNELRGLAFNLYHRGIIARYEEDIDASRTHYQECLRLAGRMGYRDTLANAHNSLGDIERLTGDLDAAEAHYRDAHDLWSAIGASGANVSTINLGLTLLQRGDWDGAASILIPLAEQLQNENAGMQLTFALAATLPIFAARGDAAAYSQALQRFDTCRASYQLHDPDLDLVCEMCISLWEDRGGEQQVRDTRRAFDGPTG